MRQDLASMAHSYKSIDESEFAPKTMKTPFADCSLDVGSESC